MTPSIGRVVLVRSADHVVNGQVEHAAVVTRVWSPTLINATVFLDTLDPIALTSITYSDAAEPAASRTWRWPGSASNRMETVNG